MCREGGDTNTHTDTHTQHLKEFLKNKFLKKVPGEEFLSGRLLYNTPARRPLPN